MSWTEELVEVLKQLWMEGLSASQIASRLGDVTRNAVIGKVHRLGLSGRAKAPQVTTAQIGGGQLEEAQAKQPNATPALAEPMEEPIPILSDEERTSVLNLTKHTCKWPIGDPGDDDFHFCGARSEPNAPYCTRHIKQAYQPIERRRRQRKAV